jgi:hypothetical protein
LPSLPPETVFTRLLPTSTAAACSTNIWQGRWQPAGEGGGVSPRLLRCLYNAHIFIWQPHASLDCCALKTVLCAGSNCGRHCRSCCEQRCLHVTPLPPLPFPQAPYLHACGYSFGHCSTSSSSLLGLGNPAKTHSSGRPHQHQMIPSCLEMKQAGSTKTSCACRCCWALSHSRHLCCLLARCYQRRAPISGERSSLYLSPWKNEQIDGIW